MADPSLAEKLQSLQTLRHTSAVFSPLVTRRMASVSIGADQSVNAVMCLSADSDRLPQRLSFATVNSTMGPARWTPIPRPVYSAAHPVFVEGAGPRSIAVVGLANAQPEKGKVLSLSALAFPDGNEHFVTLAEPVAVGVRIAQGPGHRLYCLSRQWHPPVIEPTAWPLVLSGSASGESKAFHEVLASTDVPGSFPTDTALHVGPDAIHVVHDGLSKGTASKERRFRHLELSTNGRERSAANVGAAPDNLVFTRIVVSPAGGLYLWFAWSPDRESKSLKFRVLPLQAKQDPPGPADWYVADPWMQLHELHWRNQKFEALGPSSIPESSSRSA